MSSTDTRTPDELQALLSTIYCANKDGSFACTFSASLSEQLERGRTLSDKQLAILDKLYAEASTPCPLPTGERVGKPGQRLSARLTLVAVKLFEGNYGERTMATYQDAAGNTLVHWTARVDAEVGQAVDCRFTVKGYTAFAGVRQTLVTRLAVAKTARAA